MTEAEWLACESPVRMLQYLADLPRPRQLRLFACAACRMVWSQLADEGLRVPIEMGERLAEERVPDHVLGAAINRYFQARRSPQTNAATHFYAAMQGVMSPGLRMSDVLHLLGKLWFFSDEPGDPINRRLRQAVLDVFGNPFRTVQFDPTWLTWQGGTAWRIATAAYEDRTMPAGELDSGRVRVLSDALEDAGCDNAELLGHLRSPGPHWRGCWVVDLVLGRM
jgi:hypothetical protein